MIPRREQFSSIPSKLPVAPRPAADEVRSSGLLRIAIANGLSLIELLGALDCRHARELGPLECIDGALPPAWATALAAFCHVSVPWVNALQFSHQFPYWPKEWLLRWLPMDFRHADRALSLRARYAFCTHCLGEMDRFRGFVWIRSEWTCALITHCARHRLRLYESCPECFVVDPLSIGPSSLPGRANACRRCDSLLVFKNVPCLKDLTEQVLSLQQRLLDLCTSTEMFGDTPRCTASTISPPRRQLFRPTNDNYFLTLRAARSALPRRFF